jgi:hypothetical protein
MAAHSSNACPATELRATAWRATSSSNSGTTIKCHNFQGSGHKIDTTTSQTIFTPTESSLISLEALRATAAEYFGPKSSSEMHQTTEH